MHITTNSVVSIDYTLSNNEGNILDTSEGNEPLIFIQGFRSIIPGLEKSLEGKSAGDQFQVSIPPEEGYGIKDDNLIQIFPSNAFQRVDTLEVGMQFHIQNGMRSQIATISQIDGDEVTIDANHPLAGETLNFEVKIVEVREATADEIKRGHTKEIRPKDCGCC